MKQIWSAEGRRRLRASWFLLAASIVLGAAFVGASHWYLEREKREGAGAARRLKEATARLESIRRERENLERSAEVFRNLQARGVMLPERRLELVELVKALRAQHRVASVDYEIAPQRPLALAGAPGFPALDIRASRVKLRIRALHEGDVLGFVEALAGAPQGFHPIDRCHFRRADSTSGDGLQPRVEAECALEWISIQERRGA